jgi:hypothetical protein
VAVRGSYVRGGLATSQSRHTRYLGQNALPEMCTCFLLHAQLFTGVLEMRSHDFALRPTAAVNVNSASC